MNNRMGIAILRIAVSASNSAALRAEKAVQPLYQYVQAYFQRMKCARRHGYKCLSLSVLLLFEKSSRDKVDRFPLSLSPLLYEIRVD